MTLYQFKALSEAEQAEALRDHGQELYSFFIVEKSSDLKYYNDTGCTTAHAV